MMEWSFSLPDSAQIINLYTDVKQSFAYKRAVKVSQPPTAQLLTGGDQPLPSLGPSLSPHWEGAKPHISS